MNIKKSISHIFAAATIALPAVTLAGDLLAADQSEQASVARFSAANIMAERHGKYVQARNAALEGEQSVRARSGAWMAKAQGYIEAWSKILDLADLPGDMSITTFMAQLDTALANQSHALNVLHEDAVHVRNASDSALAFMAHLDAVPSFAESQQYKSLIDAMPVRESDLRLLLESSGPVGNARLKRLDEIDLQSRIAVRAKAVKTFMAKGLDPLEKEIGQVDALLAATKVVDPILDRLDRGHTTMSGHNMEFAYFHAVRDIDPLRKDCTDGELALNGMTSPASFVSSAKSHRKTICKGIEELYAKATEATLTKPNYVAQYLKMQKTALPTACPPNVPSPACEQLAVLAALTPADLTKMDDANLAFVELSWSAALDRARER